MKAFELMNLLKDLPCNTDVDIHNSETGQYGHVTALDDAGPDYIILTVGDWSEVEEEEETEDE